MNADDELLASAYLDGELTDDERRLAESDPAVMAEVEQLRALRAELADVEPPSTESRERALAAAMGAFSEVHAARPAAEPPVAPVVEISRRRDPMRWLGAAAAVLVIGLLGVVLATGLGGGNDDSAGDTADEPAGDMSELATEEPDEDVAAGSSSDESDGADRMTQSVDAEAEMSMADEPASEPTEASASEAAEESADMPTAAADDTAGTATSPPAAVELFDPEEYLEGRPITIPEELGWVGRYLLDLVDRRELPPTPNHSCPFPDVLSRGVLLDDDVEVDIYIAVTPATRAVLAIDEATCRVLLTAALQP